MAFTATCACTYSVPLCNFCHVYVCVCARARMFFEHESTSRIAQTVRMMLMIMKIIVMVTIHQLLLLKIIMIVVGLISMFFQCLIFIVCSHQGVLHTQAHTHACTHAHTCMHTHTHKPTSIHLLHDITKL